MIEANKLAEIRMVQLRSLLDPRKDWVITWTDPESQKRVTGPHTLDRALVERVRSFAAFRLYEELADSPYRSEAMQLLVASRANSTPEAKK